MTEVANGVSESGTPPIGDDSDAPGTDISSHTSEQVARTFIPEQFRGVSEVVTSQGSRYTVLEDGKTQRQKVSTGETFAPQDLLVFIPT